MAYWAIDPKMTHPVRAMAIGGRFKWEDQGETPNTMFGIAEYPNGQYVFFNVRNVNYEGYQQQVENEYYFEDGGKIVRGQYYAKGSDKGEKVDVPPGQGHARRQLGRLHRGLPRRQSGDGQRQRGRGALRLQRSAT